MGSGEGNGADADADRPARDRAWSAPAQLFLGLSAAALATVTVLFLTAVFLHVAPSNALSRQYQEQVDGVVYPEFEQNWRLFAPNPLQQNITVDARVRTAGEGGATRLRDWIGLTARDLDAIRGNPAPSHVDQNLLRRAWDFYEGTHDPKDETATVARGRLAEQYLKRIALQRIGREVDGERVLEIEFRMTATTLAPPAWSGEAAPPAPKVRELPWWAVADEDYRGLG
ncbi:DUF5819 family protein [Kitasatospora sp. NPDC051170]|uniref:DUF5819 family protein n=1 Tax=Kitasatospora sp. NPDC051170 TaxID=3364056 RepID=UPI0037ABBB2E